MADVQEAVRRLTITASQQGVDQVNAKLKDMNKAQADVAVTSDTMTKASLSAEGAFDKLERRYVTVIRQQQDYAKVQQQVATAVAQNPALADRGNLILAEAAKQYGQAGLAAKAFAAATGSVNTQLVALSAGAGPVGTFLASFGPWGLAAAAAIGVAIKLWDEFGLRQHTVDESLTEQARLLGVVRDAYEDVAAANAKWTTQSANVTTVQLTQNLKELRDALTQAAGAASLKVSGPASTDLLAASQFGAGPLSTESFPQYQAFAGAIDRFNASIASGKPNVVAFRDEVAALVAGNPGLQELGAHFLDITNSSASLSGKLDQVEASLRLLQGTATDADRAMLGLKAAFDPAAGFAASLDKLVAMAPKANEALIQAKKLDDALKTFTAAQTQLSGSDAGPVEFAAKMAQAQKAYANAVSEISAGTEKTANSYDLMKQKIADNIKELQLQIETVGQSGAAVDALRKQHELERAALKAGVQVDQEARDSIEQYRQKLVELAKAKAGADIKFQFATVGLTDQDVRIAQQLRGVYDSVPDSLKSWEAEQLRIVDNLKQMQDLAAGFANTLVQGLLDGKSGIDALKSAANDLGRSLTSGGIKNIIAAPTNPVGYVEAGIGAITQLFTGKKDDSAAQARMQAIQAAEQRDAGYQSRTLAAQFNTSTMSGAIASFDANANVQRLEEAKNGGAAIVDLEGALAIERLQVVKKFTDAAMVQQAAAEQTLSGTTATDIQTKMAAISDAAKSLTLALTDLGQSTDGVVGEVSNAIIKLRQSFEADLQSKINSAQGKGYLNDVTSLITQNASNILDASRVGADPSLVARAFQAQAQAIVDGAQLTGQAFQDLINQFPTLTGVVNEFVTTVSASTIASDAQSWTDSLFAALNDTTTLAGQLAAFDFDANKQRLAEAQQGNQNIVLMETSLAAQRLKIIQTFNQQVMASQQSLASSITAFLANLKGGSGSVLSPQDRLSSAQTAFNSQLALAQGGDFNAANSITTFAQTLLDASKAYYGSSSGNQTIVQQVTAALQALPAQTTLADLIKAQTVAINTQGSIQTNALGVQTVAINTTGSNTVGAVTDTTGAVNDNQTVLGFIKTANDIANDNLSSVVSLQNSAVALQTSANNLSASANQTLITMAALLNTSNASLAQMVQQNVTSLASLSFLQSISSAIASSNVFLGKVVFNTASTAGSLGGVKQFAGGGWVSGIGTGTSDSNHAMLSNGEAVIPAEYAARNRSLVNDLIAGRALSANVIPFPMGGSASMSDVLAELRSLRAEVANLKPGLAQINRSSLAGAAHVREGVDQVVNAQRDQVREAAHRKTG